MAAIAGCARPPRVDPSTSDLRVRAVAAGLIASIRTDKNITFHVFPSSALSAYSRSDGQILISSALLSHLSDKELAAAIAHELGHLINHGHVQSLFSLVGSCCLVDEESAADQTAVVLLRAIREDPAELQAMLATVAADPGLSPQARRGIDQRIARLKSVAKAD